MWQAGTQCSNDRSPKADRIIIQLIKGKPGEHGFGSLTLLWLGGKSRPCREQRSLATTGRGRDERQGMRAHGLQFAEQAFALHKRSGQTGTRQLGREQHGLLLSLRLRLWPGPFSLGFCEPRGGSLFLRWCAQGGKRGRGEVAFKDLRRLF